MNEPGDGLASAPPSERSCLRVVIVGGGFSGLSAGLELTAADVDVTAVEADANAGGFAGSFDIDGFELEKFYHHWFTNDRHVLELIEELGLSDHVLIRDSRTGMFFANRLFRLSHPLDLLKFTPLPLLDRIRLGLLATSALGYRAPREFAEQFKTTQPSQLSAA